MLLLVWGCRLWKREWYRSVLAKAIYLCSNLDALIMIYEADFGCCVVLLFREMFCMYLPCRASAIHDTWYSDQETCFRRDSVGATWSGRLSNCSNTSCLLSMHDLLFTRRNFRPSWSLLPLLLWSFPHLMLAKLGATKVRPAKSWREDHNLP